MTKIINLTPHEIRVRTELNDVVEALETDIVFKPDAKAARLCVVNKLIQNIVWVIGGKVVEIPVFESTFGEVFNLPEPQEDVVYITSMPVAQYACKQGRTDVLSPDTSPGQDIRYPVGNTQAGKTFAVYGFQRF